MRRNWLFNVILFASVALHAVAFAFISAKAGKLSNNTISVDFTLEQTAPIVPEMPAVKPETTPARRPETPRDAEPPAAQEKRPPQALEKPEPARPAEQPAATRPPAPNPPPIYSTVDAASTGIGVHVSTDKNAPGNLTSYTTDVAVTGGVPGGAPANAFINFDKYARGNRKGTPGSGGGHATPAPQPEKKPEPTVDTASILRQYTIKIIGMIENRKSYPERARRRGEQGKAKMSFTITSGGALQEPKIEAGSGSDDIDAAALAALRAAAPFPPLPAELNRRKIRLSVALAFHLQ